MTAMNVWIKPEAGYIACDGASYAVADGRVLYVREKVTVLDGLCMAFGTMGLCNADDLVKQMERFPLGTQAEVKFALPRALRAVWEENTARFPFLSEETLAIGLKAVCWNRAANKAEVSVLGTHEKYTMEGQNPWTLYTGESSILHPDLEDGAGFSEIDPETGALGVLERQRRNVTMDALDGTPFCIVGGVATLYRVSAEGVTKRTLHTWPDKIGERINLRRPALLPGLGG